MFVQLFLPLLSLVTSLPIASTTSSTGTYRGASKHTKGSIREILQWGAHDRKAVSNKKVAHFILERFCAAFRPQEDYHALHHCDWE